MSRILVDCDDVLINLSAEWISELNEIYDTNYSVNDITDWDLSGMFNVSKTELLEPLANKHIWERCKAFSDAKVYLKKLFNEGHEIYIVTATDYRNFSWKIESCIKRYFPFIPVKNIICCHNKILLHADYLIDDNITNLIGGDYKGILFTRPYNKYIEVDKLKTVVRANGWEECYSIINSSTLQKR